MGCDSVPIVQHLELTQSAPKEFENGSGEQELFVVFVSQHGGFWMADVVCSALSAWWLIPPIVCFSSTQQGLVTMESFCPNDWALPWGQGPCCVVQPGTEPPMLSMQPSCG